MKRMAELMERYLNIVFRTNHILQDERHFPLRERGAIRMAHLIGAGTEIAESLPEFSELPPKFRVERRENSLCALFKFRHRRERAERGPSVRVDRRPPIEIPR